MNENETQYRIVSVKCQSFCGTVSNRYFLGYVVLFLEQFYQGWSLH